MRPLGRAIRWSHGSVRFWKTDEHPVHEAAAEKTRNLHRILPVGMIIRLVVRTGAPDVSPGSAHRVAIVALAELQKAAARSRGDA
jgi:hypothetical protein